MKNFPIQILAGVFALTMQAHSAEPLFHFDLNKQQETQGNLGMLKNLNLRLVNKENQLANIIGESGSGVSGESTDRCAVLKDGACLSLLEGLGGQPLLDDATAFTFSGWIKTDMLTENTRWPILFRNLSNDSKGGISLAVSPEGKPILAFGSPGGTVVKTELLNNQWLVSDGEWHFFVVTFDGESVRYYAGKKDEPVALIGEMSCPANKVPTPPNANTSLFGQHGGSDTLHANVDNIRLFDSELSEDELEEIRKEDVRDQQ